jgi:hypothetical protein
MIERHFSFLDDSDSIDQSDLEQMNEVEPPVAALSFPNSIDAFPESASFVSSSSIDIDPLSDCSSGNPDPKYEFLDDDDDSDFEIPLMQVVEHTQCTIEREYSQSSQEVTAALVTELPGGDTDQGLCGSQEESEDDSES